jgi:Fe-S cluster biogenesis protein NfuA
MHRDGEKEFQRRLGRIDELVRAVEQIGDPAARATATELVQLLLDLHGAGIERMLDITYESGEAGPAIIDALGRDELAGALLMLHGLHPFDLATRVAQALEKVRPYMQSHGGDVELLGVSDDVVVRLRLEGSCHGCPSSHVTLKYAVEEAIYAAAPDVSAIDTEGVAEPRPMTGFVPMTELTTVTVSAPVLLQAQA